MEKKFKTKIILFVGPVAFLALLSVCSNYSWVPESPISTILVYKNFDDDSPEKFKEDHHLFRTMHFIELFLSQTSFFKNPLKIPFQDSSQNQRSLILRC